MYISIRNKIKNYLLKRHIKKFGSKNNGYFNFFVINWSEYKDFVLWFINHRNYFVRMFGRHKFRIDQDKEAKGKAIKDIFPNHYDIENPDGSITSVFRTHQKYAKRLYYGFYPVWCTLHFFDWIIQKTVSPQFSFGYDTLTIYPNANPETVSVDGTVYRYGSNETWSSIRDGGGTGASDSINTFYSLLQTGTTTSRYASISRGILLFDTSALTSEANISQNVVSIYATAIDVEISGWYSHIAGSNPQSNTALAPSDYSNIYRTSFSSIIHSSISSVAYTNFTENGSGISAVSKTSVSKRSVQISWDIENSAPTWGSNKYTGLTAYSVDYTGTANDPKMVTTYTIPATFVPQINII